MAAPITLNGTIRVLSVKLFVLWRGAWEAECDIDPDQVALAPTSGPAVLVVGTTTLTGTVDPRGSGSFLTTAKARIVGGRGAWDQTVQRQDFYAPGGVTTATVYPAIGASVGEAVVVQTPTLLAPGHYEVSAGPASRIFAGVDWWVDFTGVTNVGVRPPLPQDPTLTIVDFDPSQQKVEFSCDNPLTPGTVLTDPRFNGVSQTVRDVEQTLDKTGAHGFAWCSVNPASRLTSALQNLILETAGRAFLRAYRYRFVLPQNGGLALQAINPVAGVPDLVPVTAWSGLAGASNTLAPSQEVFIAWDFTTPGAPQPLPVAVSLQALPLKTAIDASVEIDIGPTCPRVTLGGLAGVPIALAPPLVTFLNALQTWSAAVAGALSTAGFPIAGPQAALVAAIGTAASATPAKKVTGL
jgi:hypothetical protein